MKRHRYAKDPASEGMCRCGAGRTEDVHNLLTWRKAPSGSWVSDLDNGVVYRCRTRGFGKYPIWWPEYSSLDDLRRSEDSEREWQRVGNSAVGVSLAKAKAACEEHREARV